MMKQIAFLDMDGVLSDFAEQAWRVCGINVRSFVNRTTALTPVEVAQQNKVFYQANYSNEFWKTMPMMPFAKEVFEHLRQNFDDVFILSKFVPPQKNPERLEAVSYLKKFWFYENISDTHPVDHIIVSDKVKSHFLPKDAVGVLIDDQESNISEWENAGGKGIVYKNYSDLQKQVLKLKLLQKGRG